MLHADVPVEVAVLPDDQPQLVNFQLKSGDHRGNLAALPKFTSIASQSVHLPPCSVGTQTQHFPCGRPGNPDVFGALRPQFGHIDCAWDHASLLLKALRSEHEVEPTSEAPLLLLHPLVVVVHVARGERIRPMYQRVLFASKLETSHGLRGYLGHCTLWWH